MSKLHYLCLEPNRKTNENQEIDVERFRTSGTYHRFPYRRKPLFSYALPRHIAQSRGLECAPSGSTNGNDRPNRWQLGQTFRKPRNPRIIYTSGTRSQSHHGLFGRGNCAQSHRVGPTECACSKEAWQNASSKEARESTFKRFLSALAQDIDV